MLQRQLRWTEGHWNWFIGKLEVLYGLDGDLKNSIRYYTVFFGL